jgi:hypothetical protein
MRIDVLDASETRPPGEEPIDNADAEHNGQWPELARGRIDVREFKKAASKLGPYNSSADQ